MLVVSEKGGVHMSKQIKIFDTTLRDGEQSPGCSMRLSEKIQMAKQLERLGVDVIEAGFAIASKGDFESVKAVSEIVKNASVASLARALEKDIDRAYEAVQFAEKPRIHTFIATSDIHMQHKLKMAPDAVVRQAVEAVQYAKQKCFDIEFSAEDGTRSDPEFLARIFDEVIKAGATVLNLPDTVGYAIPSEFADFIKKVRANMKYDHKAEWSVHCHNDLGLAVANTLAAAEVGVTQLECTVNGIGERAGNAALEEIVMALHTRKDQMGVHTNINTEEIMRSSQLLSSITGVYVQPNKAIVGANAFAHESGIHQHGMLANRSTYEIMTPESVGLKETKMVLGKHSGRHAFIDRLKTLGYEFEQEKINDLFEKFKALADAKKTIYDRDIEALIIGDRKPDPNHIQLDSFMISQGLGMTSTALVRIVKNGEHIEEASKGDGPVDAAYSALENIMGIEARLIDYQLHAVTEGEDAQGEAFVMVELNGKKYKGRGLSTDILESSIEAFIDAVNQMITDNKEDDNNGNDHDTENIGIKSRA